MKKMLILAESTKRVEGREKIPALTRYNGPYYQVLKKFFRKFPKAKSKIDVVIVSHKLGIILGNERIPNYKPAPGLFSYPMLSDIESQNRANLRRLKSLFKDEKYDEIFVNVGTQFMKLIEGFEVLTNARITYASGPGLGPKAAAMKKWLHKHRDI